MVEHQGASHRQRGGRKGEEATRVWVPCCSLNLPTNMQSHQFGRTMRCTFQSETVGKRGFESGEQAEREEQRSGPVPVLCSAFSRVEASAGFALFVRMSGPRDQFVFGG